MFGSSIIDVAIGAAFVFLLLSLIASTVNEIILSLFNMRGRELLRGMQMLLDDADASGLVEKIYTHGQIYGLYQGEFDAKKPNNLPAYIPAQNFVMALIDAVPATAQPEAQIESAAQDAAALVATLRAAARKLAMDPKTEKVGKPMVSIIDAAGNDLTRLKKGIEDWYNSAMDRVSGWYKYRTQWMLFWLGLILAVSLNADAINIIRQLSMDSTLRQAVVAAATSYSAQGGAKIGTGAAGNTGGTPAAGVGAAGSTGVTAAAGADAATGNTGSTGAAAAGTSGSLIQKTAAQISDVTQLGIPLGWNPNPFSQPASGYWLQTILGWLMTAIAVSLGAPFWFDMLNKIMVVRSTVKPHEKSQDEASKD